MGLEIILIAAVSFAVTAASTAYQIIQAKKMKQQALAAADARKGFELVTEGNPDYLPIAYGRNLVGGVRTFHNTSNNFFIDAPNSDKSFLTGSPSYGGYDYNYTIWGANIYLDLPGLKTVGNQASGYMSNSMTGKRNDFLYFQQALCVGPIQSAKDVIIDGARYIDDPSLGSYGKIAATTNEKEHSGVKAALRLDFHYNGGYDAVMAANFAERKDAIFWKMAYLSAAFRIDRDDPQFNGVPGVQALIEGRKVRWVQNGLLSTTAAYENDPTKYRYDNSPALCLLDYLLDAENGKGCDYDEIDYASFESADAICRTIVQSGAAVGGKFWKPTDGQSSVSTRDIPLYECNILVDTKKPVRENIEAILATMGDARLVWSGGKYRLSLQYPMTNDALNIAHTITDDDLVMGEDIEITWPSAQDRFNFGTCRFHNEYENFKEDSVSWPPKYSNQYNRGIGAKAFPIGVGSWDDSKAGGRLLNQYSVWNGTGTGTSMTWLLVVPADRAGTYSIQSAGDDTFTLNIVDTVSNTVVYNTSRSGTFNANNINSGSVNLLARVYRITMTGTNIVPSKGNDYKGVAASIFNANSILWTTRSISYDSFDAISEDNSVYNEMLAEDNGLQLETDIFADGITDPQHALAKIEETVRTSRSATGYKFTYVITDRFLEPGDFIQLKSQTLGIGYDVPLYIRVDSTKVRGDDRCEVSGTRFDYSQLAWAVKDNVNISAPSLYSFVIPQPYELVYAAPENGNTGSSGTLIAAPVNYADLAGYVFYMHRAGIDETDSNGKPVMTEIGRSSTNVMVLPAINASSAFFGVKVLSISGGMSKITTTDPRNAITMTHSWSRGVRLSASNNSFTNSAGTITPASITLTATALGYVNPTYKWRVNDVYVSNTASAYTLSQSTDTSRVVKVEVYESGETEFESDALNITYTVDPGKTTADIAAEQTKNNTQATKIETLETASSAAVTNLATLRSDMNAADGVLTTAAANAKSAADAANSNANTVRSDLTATINTAQTTANTARTEAATVQTNLNTVQTNLNTEITNAKNSAAAANTNANTVRTDLTALNTTAQNTANTARTEAGTVQTNLTTEIQGRQTDTQSIRNVIGTIQAGDTVASLLTSEATTRANADTAFSTRIDVNESSTGQTGFTVNPMFGKYATASGAPFGWTHENGDNSKYTRVSSEYGGFAMATAVAAGTANLFMSQTTPTASITPGTWLVVEIDVKLTAGNLVGAGLLLRGLTTSGATTQDLTVRFANDADISGVINGNGVVGTTYNFRKLIQVTGANTDRVRTYAMPRWSGISSTTTSASNLVWYRVNVRPATDAEILAKAADTALNTPTTGALARISSTETTVANNNTAITGRVSTLETDINTAGTGIKGRLTTAETNISTNNTNTVNRLNTLESDVNTPTTGIKARLSTEETTRANADTALAARATKLEAQAVSGPMIAADPIVGFSDFTTARSGHPDVVTMSAPGQQIVNDGLIGTALYWRPQRAGTNVSPRKAIRIEPGHTYEVRIPWRVANLPADGAIKMRIIGACMADDYSGDNLTTYQSPSLVYNNNAMQETVWLVSTTAQTGVATIPADTKWFRAGLRLDETEADNTLVVGIGRITITDVTEMRTANARITAEETTRANADTALSNRTTTLESDLNTATTGVKARLSTAETTITNNNTAIANRVSTLESDMNTASTGVKARLSTAETAITTNNTSLANRASALEATVNTPTTGLSARMSTEETTRANADSALANRASALEATNSTNIISKGIFNDNNIGRWGGTLETISDLPGFTRALKSVARDCLESPTRQYNVRGRKFRVSGWVKNSSSVAARAGMFVNGVDGVRQYPTVTAAPALASGGTATWVRFDQILTCPDTAAYDTANVQPWVHNAGVVGTDTLSSLWTDLTIVDVTDIEAAKARLTTVETTTVNNNTAVTGRLTTLEADMNTASTGVKARLSTAETAITTNNTALANRATALEGSVNTPTTGLLARMGTEETTRANADTAISNRTNTLEARAQGNGNLVQNSDFSTLTGWTLSYGDAAPGGGYMARNEAGSAYMMGTVENNLTLRKLTAITEYVEAISSPMAAQNNVWYQVQVCAAAARCVAQVYLHFYNANNSYLGSSPVGESVGTGGNNPILHPITGSTGAQAPAGTRYMRVALRIRNEGGGTDCYGWFTRPYVSRVQPNCSTWMEYAPGSNGVQVTDVSARITTAETAITNNNAAITGRVTTLETDINTAGTGVKGRLTTAETNISTNNTNAVNRLNALESTVDTPSTGLKARMTAEETARTNTDSALATRANNLEAQVDSSAMNANPNFAQWNWPAVAAPAGWSQSGGTITQVAGEAGGVAARIATTAGNNGWLQIPIGDVRANAWYVVEADFKLISGNLNGAGVLFRPRGDAVGDIALSFVNMTDTTDAVIGTGTVNQVYRVRALVQSTQTTTSGPLLFAMSHWTGHTGSTGAANSIDWYRCLVRPASAAEILAKKVDNTINTPTTGILARVSSSETAISNNNTAVTGRVSALESTVNTPTTGLTARISSAETTISNNNTAAVGRFNALEANTYANGNLVANSDIASLDGYTLYFADNDGTGFWTRNGGGPTYQIGGIEYNLTLRKAAAIVDSVVAMTPKFTVEPNAWYQYQVRVAAHRCRAGTDIEWYDTNGAVIGRGFADTAPSGTGGGTDIRANKIVGHKSYQAPANARTARLYMYIVNDAGGTDAYGWFSRPMACKVTQATDAWVEYTPGPATPLTVQTAARMETAETAISNNNTSAVGRLNALEATVDTPTTGLKARMTAEEIARTNGDSALATRATNMEARSTFVGMNPNSSFSLYTGTGVPDLWTDAGGTHQRQPGEYVNTYAYRGVGAANVNSYIQIGTTNFIANGYYVVEADFKLVSGTLAGSGVLLRPHSNASGDITFPFVSTPDITDAVIGNGVVNRVYRIRRLVKIGTNVDASPMIFAMTHWTGFGGSIAAANSIDWYRCLVRPASTGEILAQKADTALNTPTTGVLARITSTETTVSNNNTAITGRASALETSVDTPTTGLKARMTATETAVSNNNTAATGRLTTLEARVVPGGNLVPNSEVATLAGWYMSNNGGGTATLSRNAAGNTWQLGGVENNISIFNPNPANGSAFSEVACEPFAVEGSKWYQVQARVASHRSRAWVAVFFYDVNDTHIGYSGETFADNAINAGGKSLASNPICGVKKYQAPSNAVRARIVLRQYPYNGGVDGYSWFARPMVMEVNADCDTWASYSPGPLDNVIIESNARISSSETAISTNNTALAGRASALEATVNTPTTGLSARMSAEETARSNADSALAGRATTLEARSIGNGNLVANSDFSTLKGWSMIYGDDPSGGYMERNAAGPTYQLGTVENNLTLRKATVISNYVEAWSDIIAIEGGQWYQHQARVNVDRCLGWVAVLYFDVNGTYIGYSGEGTTTTTNGASNINATTLCGAIKHQAPAAARMARFSLRLYNNGNGTNSFGWFSRPMLVKVQSNCNSWTEYTPGPATPLLVDAVARITSTETVVSGLNGKTEAFIEKSAYASGATATVRMRAKNDQGVLTSDIALLAGKISLVNVENNNVVPGGLYVSGGRTIVDGLLQANAGILVGTGKLKVAIAPTDYNVTDGSVITYGYDLGSTPSVSFGECPVGLNAGEVYSPYAENVSGTGFVARLRIKGSPTNTIRSRIMVANNANDWQVDRGGLPNASNGQYTYSASISMTGQAYIVSGGGGGGGPIP